MIQRVDLDLTRAREYRADDCSAGTAADLLRAAAVDIETNDWSPVAFTMRCDIEEGTTLYVYYEPLSAVEPRLRAVLEEGKSEERRDP